MLHAVDVGSAKLTVEVRGSEPPSVVFVSGVHDDRHVWDHVIQMLPADLLTMTYDRPGLGDSSRQSRTTDQGGEGASNTVRDLHAITDALALPQPFVLVGHSLGALLAYVYAASHPDRCAGLVLIDPSDPSLLPPLAGFEDLLSDSERGTRFSWQAVGDDITSAHVPLTQNVVIASAPGRWQRVRDPENYKPLDLPTLDARWQRWQRSLATRLNATLVIATEAGHRVHLEAPKLVASLVVDVIRAVRSSRSLQLTADPPGGQLDRRAHR